MNEPLGRPRLALMVGLPRSGKSTYARALQETGWVRIEPDAFRKALHGGPFWSPAEGIVWAAAELAVRALLLAGHAVVVDATNTTRHRRSGWLRIARDLGVPVEAFVVGTELAECLERNIVSGARHRVPEEVMERMNDRWEPVEEPGVAVRNIADEKRKG